MNDCEMVKIVWQPYTLFCLIQFFSLLIIHVWHPHNDVQMDVELSPLSNFDKIEKSKMATIMISAFSKNNISRIIYEIISPGAAGKHIRLVPMCDPGGPNPHGLEGLHFDVKPYVSEHQGIIWNCLFTHL